MAMLGVRGVRGGAGLINNNINFSYNNIGNFFLIVTGFYAFGWYLLLKKIMVINLYSLIFSKLFI